MTTGPLLLTGAGGWFGRTALWEYEQEHGPEALRRDVVLFASRERLVDFDSPYGPVKALPMESIHAVQNPRGLLHLAFLTRDKVEELGWQRYVDSNRTITAHVERVLQAWPTMPVVITSSGAAAALDGQPPDLDGNPYATLKKEEEALLERASATRMAMVFRVYAASGRFMTRPEKFALGNFLLQALLNREIRIRAPYPVIRSYVSTETLMKLCWRCLDQPGERHGFLLGDACSHTVDLPELAQLVALQTGAQAFPPQINPEAQADRYVGDQTTLLELLAEYQLAPHALDEQIRLTLRGLQSQWAPCSG